MNIPNPHWPRWIFASTADYFKQAADGIELPILIEGIDEREAEKVRANDHVEFRINGPAVALHSRMTVAQYCQTDLAYAPPFGPTWDPTLTAANQLLKKL